MTNVGRSLLAGAGLLVLSLVSALAQQTTGTPGSPGATTTIDGKQLPPPDPKFGGAETADEARKIRAEARDGYIKRTCNAWKMPQDQEPDDETVEPDADVLRRHLEPDDAAKARRAAYEDYKQRIQQAWRGPNSMVVGYNSTVAGSGPAGPVGPGPTRPNNKDGIVTPADVAAFRQR